MLHLIADIFFAILFVYLAIHVLYFFMGAVAGKFRRHGLYRANDHKKKIAVLIPSYKEDHIIIQTAQQARLHNYPASQFDVFVAADKLKPETIAALKNIPVNVKEVSFPYSSKARSLNSLLNSMPVGVYDIAIILDADNIMQEDCLEMVNDAFHKGFRAVQCHRVAKNKNTPVAILDALTEEINNHIMRSGQRALGFSTPIIGSGMAFEFEKIKEIYNKPGILGNPACDREIDFELLKADIPIEYIDDAWVMDEKVPNTEVFERQRMRWQESQIIHLRLFFDKKQGPLPKTMDYWNKLFLNLIPPKLYFLFTLFLVLLLVLAEKIFHFSILYPPHPWWLTLISVFVVTYLVAIPKRFYTWQTLKAIVYIPALTISMIRGLIRMKVNRKEFLHTPKSFTQN